MTEPVRLPRGRRITTTLIVAILLLLLAVAGGYLAVIRALHRTITSVNLGGAGNWLQQTSWNAPVMLIIGIVIAALALIVLAVAVLPSPQRLVELTGPDDHTAAALGKKSLRRTVSSAAIAIDGIASARTQIRRRNVHLDISSGLRHTDGLEQAAAAAVGRRLDALSLRPPRTLATHLSRKDS